jgi:hypothetical protein
MLYSAFPSLTIQYRRPIEMRVGKPMPSAQNDDRHPSKQKISPPVQPNEEREVLRLVVPPPGLCFLMSSP